MDNYSRNIFCNVSFNNNFKEEDVLKIIREFLITKKPDIIKEEPTELEDSNIESDESTSDEKKSQKTAFKNLSKDEKHALKQRAKEVEKLNKPHNGDKTISFNNPENIIEFSNVVKYYTNGYIVTQILKGVDLEIKKGDFVIILGPSGSGKTTLMNIISGLDRASDGVTNVCGTNLINLNDNELTKFRKENIGYVFQQYGLLPNLTVKENVEIGANLQTDKSKKLDVDEILQSVDMLQHKDKFPHQLSGGQQQRVSIARAFAKNPTILFGDEPTGAIDEEMSKMVINEFININKKFGTTVIIVTHNRIFEDLATLLIKIRDGNIVSLTRNDNPKSVDELPWEQE
ncbi:MAG: ABC transporter ATP-binding protein [Candidatus Ureaplasma intestinipullorum]|uniref:ABC transporter ATP-binding protein n=1 Tax=Candidatus Ureaplasma intestinipullorum TaxID=2838770 RepID=A0A9E2KVB3_9BACT|nr:ABC transporter ATP-binding protein [Candidatus Ureaplasma intestinipullorum]